MTTQVEQKWLPPVEYMIVEVLGLRKRHGEDSWAFPSKLNSWLNSLAGKGLLTWEAGVIPQTSRATLTEEGERAWLSEEYVLSRKWQDPATGSPADVSARLRDQYGLAERECAGAECETRFVPSQKTQVFCGEQCRRRSADYARRATFSPEMEAELLADARAGNIKGWQK